VPRRFRVIPDSLCLAANGFMEKLTLARLLAGRGQQRQAAAMLDRAPPR
jgi:hypothetical protein